MWLTGDGVAHTAAAADPTSLLAGKGGKPLASYFMRPGERRAAIGRLQALEDEVYEDLKRVDPAADEERFIGRFPDRLEVELDAESAVASADLLIQALKDAPLRWRLDYIMAGQDQLST